MLVFGAKLSNSRARLPFVVLQPLPRRTSKMKGIGLALMTVVVEGAALEIRNESVTKRVRECGCSVAQCIKEEFRL